MQPIFYEPHLLVMLLHGHGIEHLLVMLLHGYGIEHLLVMLLHGYGSELTSRTRSLHFLREFTLHLNVKVAQHFSNKDISKYSERSYFFSVCDPL